MKQKGTFSTNRREEGRDTSSEKIPQRESCELSFIWAKMKTIVQETVYQRSLTNCSEEVRGEVSMYVILVRRARRGGPFS